MPNGLNDLPFTLHSESDVQEPEPQVTPKPMRDILKMDGKRGTYEAAVIENEHNKMSMGHFFMGMAFGVILMLILGLGTGVF